MPNPYASSWSDYENQRRYSGGLGGNTGSDAFGYTVGGILGGPLGAAIHGGSVGAVGKGEGYGLVPSPFQRTTLNQTMSEDVYNTMTDEEWAAFANMSLQEQNQFINRRRQELIQGIGPERDRARAEQTLKDKQASREAAQADLIKKVQAFADEMNMPLDQLMQTDFGKALSNKSMNDAQVRAQSSGIGMGGYSAQNADLMTKRALLGYQMQRQQAGVGAMNQAYGMLSNQNAQAQDIARYNQGLDFQMQEAEAMRQAQQYQQGMAKQQGMFGMIGGIAGMAYGGPAGAAAGQQIGSSIGGMSYQNSNPYTSYKFRYPSASKGGGGGIGNASYGNY